MFGCEHWEARPDIITLGKAITSGYVPFGATVVTGEIYDLFETRPVAHANTHAGHPVACATALVNLEILEREHLVERAASAEVLCREQLNALMKSDDDIRAVNVIGLLASIEFDVPDRAYGEAFIRETRHACLKRGVLVRGQTNGEVALIILYPPLVISDEQLFLVFNVVSDGYREAKAVLERGSAFLEED
jgi:adenosylmethionine-8-amino-7-oxononanoate aminotransferase